MAAKGVTCFTVISKLKGKCCKGDKSGFVVDFELPVIFRYK